MRLGKTPQEKALNAASAALPAGTTPAAAVQLRPIWMWLLPGTCGIAGFMLISPSTRIPAVAVLVVAVIAARRLEYSSVLAVTDDGQTWWCRVPLVGRRSAVPVTVTGVELRDASNLRERTVRFNGRDHGVLIKFDEQLREIRRLHGPTVAPDK